MYKQITLATVWMCCLGAFLHEREEGKVFLKTCQFAMSFENTPSWEAPLDSLPSRSSSCLCLSLVLAEKFIISCWIEMQTPKAPGLLLTAHSHTTKGTLQIIGAQ